MAKAVRGKGGSKITNSSKAGAAAKKKASPRKSPPKASSSTKSPPKADTNIQRIEALEAMIDNLQMGLQDVKSSLGELLKIGIDDEGVKAIMESSIEGEVTGQENGRAVGWALNRVDQVSPLPVSVFYGGKKVATSLANKKLEVHSGNSVAYGNSFEIVLPSQFYDGKARSLHFKVGTSETPIANRHGAFAFSDGFPFEGKVTRKSRGVIGGWAIDTGSLGAPVVVSAVYGSEQIARSVSDLKVDSLAKRFGKKNCHHGFRLELPKRFGDGKKRNIRIVVSPWNYDILDAPVECRFSRK